MTDWVELTSSELGADKIFTSPTATALFENVKAMAEGAAGAPLIQGAAIASDAVTASKIAAGAVGASELATGAVTITKIAAGAVNSVRLTASAVTQDRLDTNSGVQGESTDPTNHVLAGGSYGFYPEVRRSSSGAGVGARIADGLTASSFNSRIWMDPGTGAAIEARQRYVDASPPYDLGDGPIEGDFVFLTVTAGGRVLRAYQASAPPWAYNGPTDIRPTRRDPQGRRFKMACRLARHPGSISHALRADPALLRAFLAGELDLEREEVEITREIQNADMPLVPHPWVDNEERPGETVVLVDPMSPSVRRLQELREAGEDVLSLFLGGALRVDNQELGRARPPGVMTVRAVV